MEISRGCSRCGSKRDLHLVTVGCEGAGRLLLYCSSCRAELSQDVDVSIPVDDLDEGTLVSLYANGKTGSDLNTVVEFVLGLSDLAQIERLRKAIAKIS